MTFARVFLFCCLLVSLPAVGQDAPISEINIDDADAAARIRSEIAEVEALQGLDAETRISVLDQLRDVETSLQRKLDADAAAALFASALDKAPEETSALRKALDESAPVPETAESLGIEDTTPLSELQQRLAKETADLTSIDSEVAELNVQIEAEVDRPAAARERIGQLEARRRELTASGEEPAVVGERPMLSNATRLAAQFRRAAHGAEINKLEQEILSHTVRLDLLRTKLEVAVRSQALLKRRTDLLRAAVNERQQTAEREAQQAAIAAEMAAADKHPVVRSLAEDNASLVVALPKRAEDLEEARFQLSRIQAAIEDVQERFIRSRQHIEIGGRSRITGRLLIEERVGLTQIGRYWPLDTEISEVGLALMFIEEQQRELTTLNDRVKELMAGVDRAAVTDDEFTAMRSRYCADSPVGFQGGVPKLPQSESVMDSKRTCRFRGHLGRSVGGGQKGNLAQYMAGSICRYGRVFARAHCGDCLPGIVAWRATPHPVAAGDAVRIHEPKSGTIIHG
jgi:potassium efflux system protein